MGSFQSKTSRQEVCFALVGPSGSGKSAFVNAIRGFADDHEKAAEVNVHTLKATAYAYPTNSSVIFWDIPGYDANIETYWKKFDSSNIDVFLIFSKERMTELDVSLAKKIEATGKAFFVIRTHIETVIKKDETPEFTEEKFEKIKESIMKQLSCIRKSIFLINNYEPRRWDFFRLIEAINKDLPFPLAATSGLEMEYLADVKAHISEKGVSGINELLKKKLDGWKDVTIRFGITGSCGTGKSSFINTIRGIDYNSDYDVAKVGVVEVTTEPREYVHPVNPNIIFVDLPGFGTPKNSDLLTYWQNVGLEHYDTFLIFTAARFTQDDLNLAKKVQEIGKTFFLVRTKIDLDIKAESKQKGFNEKRVLNDIKHDLLENVQDLVTSEEAIFLISNHDPEKWDFDRLVDAISDTLPFYQKESLTLSLTNMTRGCLKRKANLLRAQAVVVASISAATGAVPFPGVGAVLDLSLIYLTIKGYYRQFGLDEVTTENLSIDQKYKEVMRRFQLSSSTDVIKMLTTRAYTLVTGIEEVSKYILTIGTALAASLSFAVTLHYLTHSVTEMEEAALAVCCDAVEQSNSWGKKFTLKNLKKSLDEAKNAIKKHGIKAAQMEMKERLESWEHVEINLAIIGNSGVGKSSFINALIRLDVNHPNAAPVGVTETTMNLEKYSHPSCPNLQLWDTPGIGTKTFPDLKTYCERVDIERYDVFIIMSSTRFTNYDGELAEKLTSMGKPFFFVRGKIDVDYVNEKKKNNFREDEMLKKIKEDCFENLRDVLTNEKDIYLISNENHRKWDFPRLVVEIMNKLRRHKQEAFCLRMFNFSKHILDRKIITLKGKVWMVALRCLIVKTFTTESYSYSINYKNVVTMVEFYRHQLGFPEKDSNEFQQMSTELQEEVQKFYLTDDIDVTLWLKRFDSAPGDNTLDEDDITILDSPFKFVYQSLHCVLDEMNKLALNILIEAKDRSGISVN